MLYETSFLNSTILITGATGLVGSAIVRKLIAMDCRLILAVRDTAKAHRLFEDLSLHNNLEIIQYSNRTPLAFNQGEIDYIICCASVTERLKFEEKPVDTWIDNVSGIYNCLEFSRTNSIKGIIYASSISASIESDEPRDPYSESKRQGEFLCYAYHHQFGVPAKIVRLFTVYGLCNIYHRGAFWTDFLLSASQGNDIILNSSGNTIRNMCHADDAANAILHVLRFGTSGFCYDIASESNNYTIREIAHMISTLAQSLGKKTSVIVPSNAKGLDETISFKSPNLQPLKSLGWSEEKRILSDELSEILEQIISGRYTICTSSWEQHNT